MKHQITKEYYPVVSPKIPKEFDGVKIAFLSDLHDRDFGSGQKRLIDNIHEIHPDCIFVGGDMVVGKPGHTTAKAAKLLLKLGNDYPVICANGNHEYRMKLYTEQYGIEYETYVERLRAHGITYLENETIALKRGQASIQITGFELPRHYYKRGKKVPMGEEVLPDIIGKKDPKQFVILLAHNPIYFPEYAKWGADLVLAGHNHGGLIRVPFFGGLVSPQVTFFPEYDAGEYHLQDSTMVISRGLGSHGINIRINNNPELSVIELHHSS